MAKPATKGRGGSATRPSNAGETESPNGETKPAAGETESPTGETKPAAGETIRTLHGADVPAAELQHITPALRVFAMPIGALKRDPRNARVHGDRDLQTTAGSLRQFGQQHLLHFGPESKIIKVGNGRHEAAQKILKWKYIAAIPSNLTETQLKAFGILDNRTAELSEWDRDELDQQIAELGDELPDFSLADIGFDEEELTALAEGDFEEAHGFAKPPPAKEPTVKQYAEQYRIIIKCKDEAEQARWIEKLERAGVDYTAPSV